MVGPLLPPRSSVMQPAMLRNRNMASNNSVQFTAPGQMAGRTLEAWSPNRAMDRASGVAPPAPRLSELNLQGAAPHPRATDSAAAEAVIGRMLGLIADLRRYRPDSPLAGRLQGHLDALEEAYELLSSGPMVGDGLLAAMDRIELYVDALQQGARELVAEAAATGPAASALVDELAELSDAVASALDFRHTQLAHTHLDAPLSAGPMYQSKANICKAGVEVLRRQRLALAHRLPLKANRALEGAEAHLLLRAAKLDAQALEKVGQQARPRDVVGRKLLGGFFQKLRHLPAVISQRKALTRHVDELLDEPKGTSLETREVDEQAIVEAALQRVFKQAGLDPHAVHHELHREMSGLLNDQPWDAIVKPIQLQSGRRTLMAWSEVVPAAALFPSYGGHGINAHCGAEGRHAVNLAQTTLADDTGKPVFTAMRHGVNSAYQFVPKGVKKMTDAELVVHARHLLPADDDIGLGGSDFDLAATAQRIRSNPALIEKMRRAANANRADEVVAASLLADPQMLDQAMLAAAGGGPVPTLNLLSLSLLTPDGVRSGINSNERVMLDDQVIAWNAVQGSRLIELEHPKTRQLIRVALNVKTIPMNYGVNQGAVKGFGPFGPGVDLISGWQTSKHINSGAMRDLFGADRSTASRNGIFGRALAEKERALGVNHPEAVQARQLFQQVLQIDRDGSYQRAGREPYKMPARLAVLGDLLGVKVAFNCKSGKDRTGELDAEVKHLKLQMQLTGRVPEPDRVRSEQEVAHFHEVITHSGNFEMQRLNTGWAGFKLKGVPELYEQFGAGPGKKDALTENFLGLSGLASS